MQIFSRNNFFLLLLERVQCVCKLTLARYLFPYIIDRCITQIVCIYYSKMHFYFISSGTHLLPVQKLSRNCLASHFDCIFHFNWRVVFLTFYFNLPNAFFSNRVTTPKVQQVHSGWKLISNSVSLMMIKIHISNQIQFFRRI